MGGVFFSKKKSNNNILFEFWTKSFRMGRHNCLVRFHSHSLRTDLNVEKTMSLHLTSLFEREFSKLRAKSFCGLVETACYLCRGNFWLQINFLIECFFSKSVSELKQNYSKIPWRNFWAFLCKLFRHVHGNVQTKYILFDRKS